MNVFRNYLQQEYLRRTSANQNYSLRAFAKSLKINHATLSGLMSGRRNITKKTFDKLAPRLKMSPYEISKYLGHQDRSQKSYFLIQQDAFSSISEWYFDAILELSRIPNVKLTSQSASQLLGISPLEAKLALEVLKRLELLVKDKSGNYKVNHANSTNILDPDFTNAALKKYQNSILIKSMEALETVDRRNRDHTSTTLAVCKKDLPEAKRVIEKFRKDFSALMQRDPDSFDEVYQLQVSFFPLSSTKDEVQYED